MAIMRLLCCFPAWRRKSRKIHSNSVDNLITCIDKDAEKRRYYSLTVESSSYAACILATVGNSNSSSKFNCRNFRNADYIEEDEIYLNKSSTTTSTWTESIAYDCVDRTSLTDSVNLSSCDGSIQCRPELSLQDYQRLKRPAETSVVSFDEDYLTVEFSDNALSTNDDLDHRSNFIPSDEDFHLEIDQPIRSLCDEVSMRQVSAFLLEPQWVDLHSRAITLAARSIHCSLPSIIDASTERGINSDHESVVSCITDSASGRGTSSSSSVSSTEEYSPISAEPLQEFDFTWRVDIVEKELIGHQLGSLVPSYSSCFKGTKSSQSIPSEMETVQHSCHKNDKIQLTRTVNEFSTNSDDLSEFYMSSWSDTLLCEEEISFTST